MDKITLGNRIRELREERKLFRDPLSAVAGASERDWAKPAACPQQFSTPVGAVKSSDNNAAMCTLRRLFNVFLLMMRLLSLTVC